MKLSEHLQQSMHDQVVDDVNADVRSTDRVSVRCDCNTIVEMSVRNLYRRWGSESRYRCKSCDVKTYANDPQRIARFQESFAEIAKTAEHRQKCSENGKKPWADPAIRQRITEAVRTDNLQNPKKKVARDIARNALMKKAWFREHMASMRAKQGESGTSILEKIVAKILDDLHVEYETQFTLGHYCFDFKAGNHLIETQGEYWHKDSTAHDSAKATYAATLGYEIHHLWEHEFSSLKLVQDRLTHWLGLAQIEPIDFNIKDVVVRQIDTKDARVFLGAYHYLPAISKFGIHIGGFLNDELIAVASFGSLTRDETAESLKVKSSKLRELSRFCIHPARHKKNFASRFMSLAIANFSKIRPEISTLVSFADETSGHTGTIYTASNWQPAGFTRKSYVYLSTDSYYMHKKTVWDRAKKMGMTENDYAISRNLIKIVTKRKRRFVYQIKR